MITSARPPGITMVLDPGHVSLTSRCGIGDKAYHQSFFRHLYPDLDAGPKEKGLLLKNWVYKNTNPWAELIDERQRTKVTSLNDTAMGNLTLSLHHTPER